MARRRAARPLRCLHPALRSRCMRPRRLIGSIRRDCLDQVVVFGERHLCPLLKLRYFRPSQSSQPSNRLLNGRLDVGRASRGRSASARRCSASSNCGGEVEVTEPTPSPVGCGPCGQVVCAYSRPRQGRRRTDMGVASIIP